MTILKSIERIYPRNSKEELVKFESSMLNWINNIEDDHLQNQDKIKKKNDNDKVKIKKGDEKIKNKRCNMRK
jgi:hypothetical protein